MVGICAACTDEHEQRPRVSPAAAKQVIQKRAREWSIHRKIFDLSCRPDPANSAAVTCDGSPVECRGATTFERWSVHRGSKGKLVVSDPESAGYYGYCIVNVSPGD
jgi:hypothetical protein